MQIVIVGCGIVGAAIAYELSQVAGLTVTVIDRQSPASASTGAALGVLMGAISQKPKGRNLKLRLQGIETYNRWVPQLESLTGHTIRFNRQGILRLCFVGEDWQKWQALADSRRSQGWELQLCDRAFLAARCPHLSLERVIGAVYSPGDRQVDPTALTQALVAAAELQGVRFRFGLEVTDVRWDNPASANGKQRVYWLDTTKAAIEADWLIVAAGLGSTPLTAKLQSSVDIRPVLGQAIRVKLAQPLGDAAFQPVITGDDVHLVPLGNGDYWVGATVEFPEGLPSLVPQPEMLQTVMQQAIAFCPALEQATIEHQWFGLRPRPEGRPAPIVETLPDHPQVIVATGHYRNGVLLAPATATEVRTIVLGV